jgi:hypothetical protein
MVEKLRKREEAAEDRIKELEKKLLENVFAIVLRSSITVCNFTIHVARSRRRSILGLKNWKTWSTKR